jgi:serine/threonine-protein kinase HipA
MNTAYVKIWGELVGAVAWNESTGIATFEYDSDFKNLGWDLAPLQMPVNGASKRFSFPALRKKSDSSLDTFKGLPGLLADVLPDRYGNELINAWLARQGRVPESMNPVEMLCFIGSRGVGALEFEPAITKDQSKSFDVELESLVEAAASLLSKKQAFSTQLNSKQDEAIREILKIGTSVGGARPKAVIAYNEVTGEVKSGQTKAPNGFEHWLIKLDGVSDVQLGATKGYGRVEMAYYQMAIDCGVFMMPSRLLEENGRAHFMTKRFDREGAEEKHHIQTFCAMKHFDFNQVDSFSYEQLFQTMRELKLTYPEAEQMFRRMVFNVVARNCDDHTKNFSFRLKKGGKWELAPAYDLCHAYKPNHKWVSRHALSINGKRENILRSDLLEVGKSIRFKKCNDAIDEICAVVSRWNDYADACQVNRELKQQIGNTLIKF